MSERERISDALVGLCFESSYRETTLEMLLERAEVDRERFECHFADLEDCFYETYREHHAELMDRLRVAVADQPTWRDGLRQTAYALVDYLAEDEKRTNFTWVEAPAAGERVGILIQEAFEQIFDLLDRGRDERAGARTISRATAEAVGGSVFIQMYAAYEEGSIEAVRAKVPEMLYMAVLPYVGEDEAAEELDRKPPPMSTRTRITNPR